jgi:hypothetical protein
VPQDIKLVDARFLRKRFGQAALRVALHQHHCFQVPTSAQLFAAIGEFPNMLCMISRHLADAVHDPAMI